MEGVGTGSSALVSTRGLGLIVVKGVCCVGRSSIVPKNVELQAASPERTQGPPPPPKATAAAVTTSSSTTSTGLANAKAQGAAGSGDAAATTSTTNQGAHGSGNKINARR